MMSLSGAVLARVSWPASTEMLELEDPPMMMPLVKVADGEVTDATERDPRSVVLPATVKGPRTDTAVLDVPSSNIPEDPTAFKTVVTDPPLLT